MIATPGRLVRAEIDLSAFSQNIASIRSLLKPTTKLIAVVKGNAYGHGIVPIAKKAAENDIDYFGVVCLYEARQLREGGIQKPILLLNYTDVESLDEAGKQGEDEITAEEVANKIGTINYEVLTSLSERVTRIYE